MTVYEYTDSLIQKLLEAGIPKEEFEHRKNSLIRERDISAAHPNDMNARYYQLAHEIKCFSFLRQFGTVNISLDSKHAAGCDAILEDYYQIEFVCASLGNEESKKRFAPYSIREMDEYMFVDYSLKKSFLFSRITSALGEKKKFYDNHIEKNTISANKAYLVFLGLGELACEMLIDDCGIDLTEVLLGKGDLTLSIDSNGNVVDRYYQHKENFYKHNGAPIDCNLFCRNEFRCISGIIFSKATLYDDYDFTNTWLFLNPFANVKVRKKDFPQMVYWSDKNGIYQPRRNGKLIK